MLTQRLVPSAMEPRSTIAEIDKKTGYSTQTILATRGSIAIHRKLGWIGAAWIVAMVVLGWFSYRDLGLDLRVVDDRVFHQHAGGALGHDPLELIREELAAAWGPPRRARTFVWDLDLRIGRK